MVMASATFNFFASANAALAAFIACSSVIFGPCSGNGDGGGGRLLRMNGGSKCQDSTRHHGDKWQMTHLFLPTRYVLLVIWLVMSRWPTLYTLMEPYSTAYLGLSDFKCRRLVGERTLNSQWLRPLYSESVQ